MSNGFILTPSQFCSSIKHIVMTTTSFGYHVRENKKNSKFKHNNNGAFNVKSQFPPHVTI